MKLTEEQLKQISQEQTARSTARQLECLTEDQFARAASGALEPQERAAIARHLITCAECTEEYRIVRSLKDWANEADQVMGSSSAAVAVLPEQDRKDLNSPRWNTFASSARATLALAAMLFIVLFAGAFLLWKSSRQNRELAHLNQQLSERERALDAVKESLTETERRLNEVEAAQRTPAQSEPEDGEKNQSTGAAPPGLQEPQLEVPIIDLDPSPLRGGSSRTATTIDIPSNTNLFTLILNFSGKSYPAYEIELVDNRGRTIWGGRAREKNQSRSINLTLPRNLVRNGDYSIKLYGLNGGDREGVAEYPLQVRAR